MGPMAEIGGFTIHERSVYVYRLIVTIEYYKILIRRRPNLILQIGNA